MIKNYLKDFLGDDTAAMVLLEMYEKHLNNEKIIFQKFFEVFGNLTFIKTKSQNNHFFLTFLPKLENSCYELTNSNLIYDSSKYIYNLLNDPLKFIDTELSLNKTILISLDLGKSLYINNTILLPENISEDILEKFLNVDNHYYIIVDKILKNDSDYYKAFSGYNDINEFCLIEAQYLKRYINHIISDKIKVDKKEKIDFFKFEEEI